MAVDMQSGCANAIVAIIVKELQTYSKEVETTTHADALQKNILKICQMRTQRMA
jgi:hypothetical protein